MGESFVTSQLEGKARRAECCEFRDEIQGAVPWKKPCFLPSLWQGALLFVFRYDGFRAAVEVNSELFPTSGFYVCRFNRDLAPAVWHEPSCSLQHQKVLLWICSAAQYFPKGACFPRGRQDKRRLELLSWPARACLLFSAYHNPISLTCPFS